MIARIILFLVLPALILSGIAGCGKSDAAKPASGEGTQATPGISAIEQEAHNAAMAEVQKHFTKAADGWITARVSGSAYAPDHFLREIRDIQIESMALQR